MTEQFGQDKTSPHVILSAGMQVSQYKIIEKIGAGGMGEVYLAADNKLDRRVALKFLPAQYSSDADLVSRFKREAQAAAKLDHPNIVTIYEVGEYQGRPFFAMQYVEGQSFVQLAHETTLPLQKIIEFSIQILEGLQRAHQAGIIHRDIKSANILIDSEQRPKILDFGLATVQGGEKLTKVGSTLGTVAYMSPEQAHGQIVDQRSDLFSFGVVLYELIAARTPFKRDTDAATLKAITEDTPEPLARFRAKVPEELQRIVNKLLERDPSLRYQTASGAVADLKKLAISSSSGAVTPIQKHSNHTLIATIIAAVAVIAFVGIWALNRTPNSSPSAARSLELTRVTNNGQVYTAAISPDGRYLVYGENKGGKQSLYVRQVATASVVQILATTDLLPGTLIFTPDANYVCFTAKDKSGGRSLYQVPTLGGSPKLLLEDCSSRIGWSPDGKQFAFTRVYDSTGDFAVMTAHANGQNQRRLIGGKGEIWYQGSVSWSPDGKLIAVDKGMWKPNFHHEVVVVRVEGGAEIWSTSGNWLNTNNVTWEHDGGGLIFVANERNRPGKGQVVRVAYPGGEIERLTRDLAGYGALTTTSDNSVICAIYNESRAGLCLSQGAELGIEAKEISSGTDDGSAGLLWSRDGRILYTSQTTDGIDIWSINEDGSQAQILVKGDPVIYQPQITGDGRYLVFVSVAAGIPNIWRADIDGQNLKQLTSGAEDYRPSSTPDGKWIVFDTWRNGPNQLARMSIDGGQVEILSPSAGTNPTVSPDGKWIAYNSREQGQDAPLVIRPFDRNEHTNSYTLPPTSTNYIQWSPDSKSIFYINTLEDISNVWNLDIATGAMKQVTKFKSGEIAAYDWSPDLKKLAISRGQTRTDVVLLSTAK
jgi:serine/threonine protein kinase